jgi:hypothetical protein
MTDLCEPSSGDRKEEGDAPAIAGTPPTWRLLRALSLLRRWFSALAKEPVMTRPSVPAYRLTDYQLQDIGLALMEYESTTGLERSSFSRLTVVREDTEGHL